MDNLPNNALGDLVVHFRNIAKVATKLVARRFFCRLWTCTRIWLLSTLFNLLKTKKLS